MVFKKHVSPAGDNFYSVTDRRMGWQTIDKWSLNVSLLNRRQRGRYSTGRMTNRRPIEGLQLRWTRGPSPNLIANLNTQCFKCLVKDLVYIMFYWNPNRGCRREEIRASMFAHGLAPWAKFSYRTSSACFWSSFLEIHSVVVEEKFKNVKSLWWQMDRPFSFVQFFLESSHFSLFNFPLWSLWLLNFLFLVH